MRSEREEEEAREKDIKRADGAVQTELSMDLWEMPGMELNYDWECRLLFL